jgi:hypothetical protein
MTILIETRVKCNKAESVRNMLRLRGKYIDNYTHHENGRIWLHWDDRLVDIKHVKSSAQMIHCGVYDTRGNFLQWFTAIYAFNILEQRRKLWRELEDLHNSQQGPWCLMGDFNNVLKASDRVGGKLVHESEYTDLTSMMNIAGLSDMDNMGDYFTWSNKHTDGMIYSKIDRVLGNVDWFQMNLDSTLTIMDPGVSDHNLLCLRRHTPAQSTLPKSHFKFLNYVANMSGFSDCVTTSWCVPLAGSPMYILWRKLLRLQPLLRQLSRPILGIHITLEKARNDLQNAHNMLLADRMNPLHIMQVKRCTEEVIRWNDMEEQMLRQKSKIDWLKLGDGNNRYFHASLKAKQKQCELKAIYKEDDTMVTTHEEIEQEVLGLYGNLMGKADTNLEGIGIVSMRDGPQLTSDQRMMLVAPVQETEIFTALKSIGDLKAPGLDGYGAMFFKASWNIIKLDVIAVVQEFLWRVRFTMLSIALLLHLFPNMQQQKQSKNIALFLVALPYSRLSLRS